MALITDAPQSVRQMSAARVAVLALCVVASGPTALEANLSAGGGLWTVVFLLLMPLVICLPQILIVAELSSMMPTQAGAVVWVTRGLGPRFGFMYGWTAATMSLSDVALPVILCQQLMFRLFEIQNESVGWFWVLLLRCAILGITVIFAFRSLNSVSLLTAPATGICILVVSIGFAAASPRLTWDAIAHRTAAEKTNWGVLAAATLWQYNGWITVGATSGEAKDHTAFVRGAILALGGCVVQYLLATFVMIAVADGPNDFKMEMYVIVAFQKALTGLGLVMNVLLIVLTVSSAAVALSLNARQMWGLSRFGWLPESFGKVTEDGTPYVLQLIIAACTVPIIFVDFTVALVVFYTLSAINQSWVPIAQWELRRLRNASRPFEVPGGAGLNALVVATPLFGMGGVVVMNIFDNPMMVLVSFAALATIAGVALTATSLFVPFDAAVPEESTTLVKTRPPPGYPSDSVSRELQLRGFI